MWFSVNAIDSKVSSRFFGVSSHSHTVMQCQPIAASLFCSSLSRSLFLRIFATQNSLFVFGILQHSELSITSNIFHLPSALSHHPSSLFHLTSSILHLPSSVLRLTSSFFRLPSYIFRLTSSLIHPFRCWGVRWSIV